jgi:hypothetical protein
MAGTLALIELHTELDQILNSRRSFGHNRADHIPSHNPAPASSVAHV